MFWSLELKAWCSSTESEGGEDGKSRAGLVIHLFIAELETELRPCMGYTLAPSVGNSVGPWSVFKDNGRTGGGGSSE